MLLNPPIHNLQLVYLYQIPFYSDLLLHFPLFSLPLFSLPLYFLLYSHPVLLPSLFSLPLVFFPLPLAFFPLPLALKSFLLISSLVIFLLISSLLGIFLLISTLLGIFLLNLLVKIFA